GAMGSVEHTLADVLYHVETEVENLYFQ
nr:Chain C, Set1/Ash2 histone methyltransferase complex subunit ASH2 [Homo sapiens]4RIQ_F Chain F, Set1/Ash2 histone methyltransferase complex subunit ASH2 [Homo sapiens]4RIQ_I Chain I, Set1/Ash2 histone methyltransferase complex subunit ASH2 [Homo sapiens]4RIQ_L Chain L, Set1/Ash2 histone methyltransferase complex subunit ASH2 [Homo sapiens]4RIQ_O Chain O, Set1/Ash2 histone methyltransferase complex subunit ASH2 [Homo sapiens]4RIQ_R Chain R, Set1/Ash2 histone methyltransferase complex subunit